MRDDDVRSGRAGAFGRRGVNVLDVNSTRLLRFRATALVGTHRARLPLAPQSPDPLLLDPERIGFNERSDHPRSARSRYDPEPLQSPRPSKRPASACSRATRARAAVEGNGNDLRSSLRAIASEATVATQYLPTKSTGSHRRSSRCRREQSRASDIDLSISLAERDRTLIENDKAIGRGLLLKTTPRLEGAFAQRRDQLSNRLTPYDGVLPADLTDLREHYFQDERQLSPSALETYGACPQRFLLGNVLRLSKIEEPESVITISPLTKGTLIPPASSSASSVRSRPRARRGLRAIQGPGRMQSIQRAGKISTIARRVGSPATSSPGPT